MRGRSESGAGEMIWRADFSRILKFRIFTLNRAPKSIDMWAAEMKVES
jgi:hypothetical protein